VDEGPGGRRRFVEGCLRPVHPHWHLAVRPVKCEVPHLGDGRFGVAGEHLVFDAPRGVDRKLVPLRGPRRDPSTTAAISGRVRPRAWRTEAVALCVGRQRSPMDVRLTYEDGTIRVVAGDATGNGANDADGDALESLPPPPVESDPRSIDRARPGLPLRRDPTSLGGRRRERRGSRAGRERPRGSGSRGSTPAFPTDYDLREYQREALDAWRDAGDRGVLELPTGAGKTVIAIRARDGRARRADPRRSAHGRSPQSVAAGARSGVRRTNRGAVRRRRTAPRGDHGVDVRLCVPESRGYRRRLRVRRLRRGPPPRRRGVS